MTYFRLKLRTLFLLTTITPVIGVAATHNIKYSNANILNENELPTVTLEKITVTGELLTRSIDETGNSVIVIEERQLNDRQDLKTVTDVLQQTPNVTVVTGTGKAPTIRGVDGTGPAENAIAFFAGSRPRLNIQVDERSLTYNEVAFSRYGIWDLNQVEILRGPQSSLSGRNAIAGTVKINTNAPTNEKQAAVRAELGNLNQKRLSFMVNQPLSDTIAVRLSADGFQRESPVDYDSYAGVSDPAEIEGHTITGKVLFTPNGSKKTRMLLSLIDNEYTSPHTEIVVKPFYKQRSNFPQQAVHRTHVTSANIDYSAYLNDYFNVELKGYTSKVELERQTAPGRGSATIDTKEFALEPRFHYYGDNGSEWVVGMRYHDSSQDENMAIFGGLDFEDTSKTMAVYGEGVLPLADNYEVVAGLRYEKEERKRTGGDAAQAVMTIDLDDSYEAVLPKVGLNYYPNDNQTVGILLSRGYNAGGAGITAAPPITSYEYEPEYVNTIELFGRQKWRDSRLQTTQNLFYSKYDDMQLPFDLTPNNSRDEAFTIRNADEVSISGLELGATWEHNKYLNLTANLAFLDTEISEYATSGIEGNSLFMAPKWSGQVGSNWSYNRWHGYLNGHFSDGYYTDINNRPRGKTSAQTFVNAGLAYDVSNNTNVYTAVANVLDNQDPIAKYPGINKAGAPDSSFDTAVLMQPRTFTIGVKTTF